MSIGIRSKATPWALAAWLASAMAAPATAQSFSPAQGLLDNRFVLNVSAYLVSSDVRASLNGQTSDNPDIDFDQTFGRADDAVRARLDARWRLSPRHQLRFMYFDHSTRRTATLQEDIAWGDYVLLAGSTASEESDFRVGALAYEYAFVREPSYQVAATIGVHVTEAKLTLSGTAQVQEPESAGTSKKTVTETAKGLAPLPLLGLRATWVVAPQWYLEASAQVFSLNSGDFQGNWSDLRLSGTWMFDDNVGVGLGYTRFASRYDVDKRDFDGRIKRSYSGLQAFLTTTF